MLFFGLGLGALLLVVGILTYWLAPRVGPNPWFGVRTGYSVANREIWDQTNRVGGIAFVACGLVEGLLAVVVGLLGLERGVAMALLMGWLLAGTLGAAAWLFLYSRRLAQATPVARELQPVAFHWAYVAPVLASAALLLTLAVYYYPQLPTDRVATHFDLAGRPNDWMDRTGFLVSFLAIALLCTLLDVAVVLWATREPLIAIDRLGSRWWMSPQRGLVFLGAVMTAMNLLFIVVLWDVATFNIVGSHPLPMEVFVWGLVPVVLVGVVAGFFLLAQRVR